MSLIQGVATQPQLREEIALRDKAMSGDIVFAITPATVAPAPTSAAWERSITIEIQDASGNVHTWINQDYATSLAIADTSTAGTASITSTTLSIVEGRAVVAVAGDAVAWLNAESDTLTVSAITVMGYTVSSVTSVETFTT